MIIKTPFTSISDTSKYRKHTKNHFEIVLNLLKIFKKYLEQEIAHSKKKKITKILRKKYIIFINVIALHFLKA